jgi:hypothetical protein
MTEASTVGFGAGLRTHNLPVAKPLVSGAVVDDLRVS